MDNMTASSARSDSASLVKDIVTYYYAKNKSTDTELFLEKNWISELFDYKYTELTIKILETYLLNMRTLNETYISHFVTLWKLFDNGESDLFYLLLKYNILGVKELEEYPQVKYEQSEKQFNGKIAWNHGREIGVQMQKNR